MTPQHFPAALLPGNSRQEHGRQSDTVTPDSAATLGCSEMAGVFGSDERAIVAAAARVAVDELIRPGAHPELAYNNDEECLKEIAGELGITDFQPWRLSVIERAREIVSIEYVRAAIRRIASDLQAAPLGDGLTGERISSILRTCEMAKPR